MIREDVFDRVGVAHDADVPAFTSLGGYPLVYFAQDGGVICPDCVNDPDGTIRDAEWADFPMDTIVGAEIHWEGPALICESCNTEIPSAYGDPEEDAD